MSEKRTLPIGFAVATVLPTIASAAIFSEDFSTYTIGDPIPAEASYNAVVVDGTAQFGSGNALSLLDLGTAGATEDKVSAYEANFAADEASEFEAIQMSFDIFNDEVAGSASSFIFGVAGYNPDNGVKLNSTSARFFNLEFVSTSDTLKIRTSAGSIGTISYNLGAANTIELFINDNEADSVDYAIPDSINTGTLPANSFALYVNGTEFGITSMGDLALGDDSGLGRFSFYSGTSVISGFTIDNISIESLGLVAVPEPRALSFLVGLMGLGLIATRRVRPVLG